MNCLNRKTKPRNLEHLRKTRRLRITQQPRVNQLPIGQVGQADQNDPGSMQAPTRTRAVRRRDAGRTDLNGNRLIGSISKRATKPTRRGPPVVGLHNRWMMMIIGEHGSTWHHLLLATHQTFRRWRQRASRHQPNSWQKQGQAQGWHRRLYQNGQHLKQRSGRRPEL